MGGEGGMGGGGRREEGDGGRKGDGGMGGGGGMEGWREEGDGGHESMHYHQHIGCGSRMRRPWRGLAVCGRRVRGKTAGKEGRRRWRERGRGGGGGGRRVGKVRKRMRFHRSLQHTLQPPPNPFLFPLRAPATFRLSAKNTFTVASRRATASSRWSGLWQTERTSSAIFNVLT